MRRAIDLATLALGATSPNPIVGAVVLDATGNVVGEGFHAGAGRPHAEVEALSAAGDRAAGGTVVVTLEPCAHTGRTPPCTDALITASVRRVVFAVADPNPRAAGGAVVLRAAGIDVESGLFEANAARGNEAWLHFVRTGRPFITWKTATTLDGRVAAADGSSRWITGEAARADVHRLRGEHDAVMVGTGTVLADDPQLTARTGGDASPARRPLRVVVGAREIPATARIFDATAPTVVISERDPEAVLKRLAERDIVSVLLEGGPTLAGGFLSAGMIDRIVAYVAPALLGAGPAMLPDVGIGAIGDALRWRLDDVLQVGVDARLTLRPQGAGE